MFSILEWEDLLPSWWQGAICLTISQIVREYSRNSYIYTEAGSKNKQGTFTERHISNKIVIIYPLTALLANPLGPWFSTVPVCTMVSQMCGDAGVKGHKTNCSLRATTASELFRANVPEKIIIIQERPGHNSFTALRTYEHITEQFLFACHISHVRMHGDHKHGAATSTTATSASSSCFGLMKCWIVLKDC